HDFSRPKMRQLCKVLARVDEVSVQRAEPELAVLVVRQSDGLPGQGWWVEGARAHEYDGPWEGPEAERLVRRLHAAAFDYWRARG
ncbi:MAG TPA: ribose-phosphate pyrophosphokinase, partial [Sphingomicrobium sp.]|nr:ribose-phosphate pyrophosphokinase [Sphingomicrobium sp.]